VQHFFDAEFSCLCGNRHDFFGGPIVTVNAKNEEVEALAVKDGKNVALGHIAYVNTKAFEVAGVTNKTPNPPRGS